LASLQSVHFNFKHDVKKYTCSADNYGSSKWKNANSSIEAAAAAAAEASAAAAAAAAAQQQQQEVAFGKCGNNHFERF